MRTIKILFILTVLLSVLSCEKLVVFPLIEPTFEDSIPRKEENEGVSVYQTRNPSIAKYFEISFDDFNSLIQKNLSKKYSKFYYVQNGNDLNIIMIFSDYRGENKYEESDKYYDLKNGVFNETTDIEKIKEEIEEYKNNLRTSMYTDMIEYSTNNINSYNYNVSNLIYDIEKLKFVMMSKKKSSKDYVVFAVHPINRNNTINEKNTFGYDAGTLYP